MTPDQLRTVEDVIAEATARPEFSERFYANLFAVAPETRAMFDDVEAMQAKLRDELGSMVTMLNDLDALEGRARELGERHRGYGVRAVHYRVARQVMQQTLAEVLGEDFGPAEAEAWDRATMLITELMQSR